MVRPNQGLLAPNGSETISILLVDKDKQLLLQSYDRLGQSALDNSKDKFLVQSCVVSPEFAKKYYEEKAKARTDPVLQKELADALTSMWNAMSSSATTAVYNKKLHVKHVATASMEGDVLVTSSAAAAENSKNSLAAIEAMSPEQMFLELASLRRKYDELVSFSVNLTAERDILNNTLEQTRRDLNREVSSRAALENSGGKGSGRVLVQKSSSSSLLTMAIQFLVVTTIAFLTGVKLTQQGKVGSFILSLLNANASSVEDASQDAPDL